MIGPSLVGSRIFVTGGAGFVGSHLTDRLLALGCRVTVYDNFSTGRPEFLAAASRHPAFTLVKGDLLDRKVLESAVGDHDLVVHLAANADVRHGVEHPCRDLEQNTLATSNLLEAMRVNQVQRMAYSSTGSIYGEPNIFPTPEDAPFPVQTSLYGASKLAAEGLISAYSNSFGIGVTIFRFVSILGERYTHGHVADFCRKLSSNPSAIEVLGNGHQRKSYLYVQDCIDGMLAGLDRTTRGVRIFNLGTDEYCTVDESLGWICSELGVSPQRQYTGGERGWIGDSPFIFLDCSRIKQSGWRAKLSIREAVIRTVHYLRANPWVLERAD